MSAPAAQSETAGVADRLRGVVVNVRADLDTSRHVFRGEPAYIVRDPVSFQSHVLSPDDYAVLVALDADRPLGETFDMLVERGDLENAEEDDFYAFVLSLHRSGLLNLPVSDGKALFQRFERRRRARRKSLLMSLFFLRVPLWDPDEFLTRTIGYVRWAFTRWAFVAWLILVSAAGVVAWTNRDELVAPLLSALELQNVPLLWLVLVALKVLHEFGHAFACKAFGGDVPEMGAFFIVGTPCAYVDATAAWGFPQRDRRIIVSLAGMYIESVCAAVALFVWAATDPGLLNSLAFQTALMASVVTLGFNLNPLAKFDGYYILSDALAIPNLRQRASDELRRLFDRVALGLHPEPSRHGFSTRVFLMAFGIASVLYRVSLVVGISAMIALKFFIVGVGLAAMYIGMTLFGFIAKSLRYLWWAPHTMTVRRRAIAVSVVALALLPAALLLTPVPAAGGAWGVLEYRDETVVRAGVAGVLGGSSITEGDTVTRNDPIASLINFDIEHESAVATAQARLASLTERRELHATPTSWTARRDERVASDQAATLAHDRAERLRPRSPTTGVVVHHPLRDRRGAFIKEGETLAVIASGPLIVEVLVDEALIASASPEVGQTIAIKAASDPSRTITGIVRSVAPAGSRQIDNATLTQAGVNRIAATPTPNAERAATNPDDAGRAVTTATAGRTYFRVTIELPDDDDAALRRGGAVKAMFTTTREPAGVLLYRRVALFLNELRSG